MFSKQQILDLKRQIDVKEFYKRYIGTIEERNGRYWTICPFHNDHDPSFMIDPERGIWRCWVDGISGDIIDFIQMFYGLSFVDAVQYIIKEFDIDMELSEEAKLQYKLNTALSHIHNSVSDFFQKSLVESPDAIEYLKSRKIDIDTIKKFRIGFIPQTKICGNDSLLPLYIRGGLSYENGGNFFSKDRISIPFQDNYGNVVGFTARTIVDEKPKYLHTKTTDIFKKDELLFAFNHARESIKETKSVFIVEGQFDCIRAHQFGITNCVALSGLAFSSRQLSNLKSLCKNYYIIIEDSKAEQVSKNGSESPLDRMYDTIVKNNYWSTVKIIKLYEGNNKCDLDEFLLKYGRGKFLEAIKEAPTYNEYKLLNEIKGINYKKIEDKKAYVYRVRKYLNKITNSIDKNQYIELLARKLELPENDIIHIITRANTLDKSTIQVNYDTPVIASQKYIIASLFSKFGYSNSYKVLEELNISEILDEEFLNIYNEIKEVVLQNGQSCDIINLLHSSNLTSEEKSIADDCFFKSDELDYLDEKEDKEHSDNLFELREFLKDQVKNLE